ncbi:MAG: hypothetical protein H6631_08820 [Anaerolineaceae bacterium]|nr:hypothetical protein [Anaerolineaceae bacterium]MCB9100525.1 hypothetical protein [Anaerolineales bacterium]
MSNEQSLEVMLATFNTLLEEVETNLMAAADGASLCLIGKERRGASLVKYLEGQYYALKTAKRVVEQQGDMTPPTEVAEALRPKLAKAEKMLDHYQGTSHPDVGWVSYYQGEIEGYGQGIEIFERLGSA